MSVHFIDRMRERPSSIRWYVTFPEEPPRVEAPIVPCYIGRTSEAHRALAEALQHVVDTEIAESISGRWWPIQQVHAHG